MKIENENQQRKTLLFIIGLIFTSICLRGPIASVGSLIESMEPDLGVSKSHLGFITTLPLLVFAASSILIPRIANSVGHTRILVIGMFVMSVGCYTRSLGGYFVVLAGTLLIGIGVSVGNVLISGIIKENMPLKIGLATGLYLCFQNISATIGAGLSYPLAVSAGLGWRNVLAVWAVPGLLAAVSWIIFGLKTKKTNIETKKEVISLENNKTVFYKSKLAWSITIIMGTQSVNYYCVTAWLPSILESSDMSFEMAGYVASAFQLFAIPSIFIAPHIIAHTRNKTLPATVSGLFYMAGAFILMSTENVVIILIGLFLLASGGGASFAWVVAIIAVVSSDSHEATRLSGMAQSVGYIMAAVAPTLAGLLYDVSHNWMVVLWMVVVMSMLIVTFGLITGKILKK